MGLYISVDLTKSMDSMDLLSLGLTTRFGPLFSNEENLSFELEFT